MRRGWRSFIPTTCRCRSRLKHSPPLSACGCNFRLVETLRRHLLSSGDGALAENPLTRSHGAEKIDSCHDLHRSAFQSDNGAQPLASRRRRGFADAERRVAFTLKPRASRQGWLRRAFKHVKGCRRFREAAMFSAQLGGRSRRGHELARRAAERPTPAQRAPLALRSAVAADTFGKAV